MRFPPLALFLLFALILSACGGVKKPSLIEAEDWGSEPDPIPESYKHDPAYITIHHAGVLWNEGEDPYKKIRGLQQFGKNEKNWPDVPYHFLIAPDGRLFEGRPIKFQAETNTDYDLARHVGIQLWGNFEEQRVSEAQLQTLVSICAYIADKYDISPLTIQGHLDVAPDQTVCPGRDLYRYIDQGLISEWVSARIEKENPKIELLPPIEDGPADMIPGATLMPKSAGYEVKQRTR